MQQEPRQIFKIQPNTSTPENPQTFSLHSLIKQTYSSSSTTQQVKSAQTQIQNLLRTSTKTLDELFNYINLKPPYNIQIDNNFKRACANFVKKQYYQVAQGDQNKNSYIEKVYQILTAIDGVDMAVKEIMGVALEYIFNKDQQAKYKLKWCQHVKGQMFALVQNSEAWTAQTIQVLHGIVIFFVAFLNSQVQPDDQIVFINQILKPLCKTASLCCQFAKDNINQTITLRNLFKTPQKIFQFLQMSIQRLLQQQQIISQQLREFLSSQHLTNINIQYLYVFSQQQSVISKYPQLNQIKASILQILYLMVYRQYQINPAIVTLIYGTFVQGCLRVEDDDDQDDSIQKILVKSIAILDGLLDNKMCYQFFLSNKIQICFTLLMYSKSTNKQLSDLLQSPQKFAELAQQYSQCYSSSSIVKIRAANFLKTFVTRVDEILTNMMELCVIFITGSLASSQNDSQVLKLAKQTYADFPFMNLKSREKLDISFMILTVLAPFLEKRQELKTVIISIFMTNFNTIFQITDQLVLVRLIRVIGYFPNSLYFKFILQLMPSSRAFLIQGITCFDRISRNKVYLQVFPMMHYVFEGLVDYMEVNDPIFDRMIAQNYQNILKKNDKLYLQVLEKIYQTFIKKIKNLNQQGSKQNAIVCMNYLQKLIKIQKNEKKLKLLEITFEKIQNQAINIPILQQNFISTYQTIISKSIIPSQKIQNFVKNFSRPQKLNHYSSYSQYFKLLNKFILKAQNNSAFANILGNLMQYMGKTQYQKFNFGIVPQVAYNIGHIVVAEINMQANIKFVQFLVKMATKKQQVRGYLTLNQPWYLFLILHYIQIKPAQVRQHLIQQKMYYPLMISLFNTKWTCKIQRKAAVLAIIQLLYYQPDTNSIKQLIKYCVTVLNAQKQRYQTKKLMPKNSKKSRKRPTIIQKNKKQPNDEEMNDNIDMMMDQQMEEQRLEQQRMQNQIEKTKDEDNILFKQFRHPFDKICQFSVFKQKIQSMINFVQIKTEQVPRIVQVLQYEWHKNSIRRVFRIYRQQQ